MTGRANNFDLIRLVLASSVFLWHVYDLSKVPELHPLASLLSADIAVKAFFVVSGFLVVMSCETSSSLRSYAEKRVRRIYPAYCGVVLACAIGGIALSSLAPGDYLSWETLRYLIANLTFLNFLGPTLPGVFDSNPWQEVNGALWTLKIEVMFYAFVPILFLLFRRLGGASVIAGLYLLSVAYSIALGELHQSNGQLLFAQLQRQLPGQLTYFLVGAALYLYRERLVARWMLLAVIAACAYVLHALVPGAMSRTLLEPLYLGIAVILTAIRLPFLGNFARFGDLSYGIYIIHFPVIQVFVHAGWFAPNPWFAFALCATTVAALSFASWHLLEKPFLGRRSHYRVAERARD